MGTRISAVFSRKLLKATALTTLCCLLYLSVTTNLWASTDREILVIKSGPDDIYNQVIESFNLNLQQQCSTKTSRCDQFHLQIESIKESAAPELKQQIAAARTLIISVGHGAARFVAAQKPGAPVLNTLIPRQTFNHLKDNTNSKASAIYLDQPVQRQLRLIRESMPSRKRVGILIGVNSRQIKRNIIRITTKYGLKPQFGTVSNEESIGSVLNKLMEKSDVLLALPDPLIYNRHTIRNILLSSYHQQIPVIGFSEAYVNAGAIASAFSSPKDIGRHMGDMVGSFLSSGSKVLPGPVYPKYYSIKCNKRVANSLQIHLPPVELLNHSPGRQSQ
jgi:ABC-type uncharacterized transport system substrate-binding protein